MGGIHAIIPVKNELQLVPFIAHMWDQIKESLPLWAVKENLSGYTYLDQSFFNMRVLLDMGILESVLYVDDGSTDGSSAQLDKMERTENINVHHLEGESGMRISRGKLGAVLEGYKILLVQHKAC